MRQTKYEVFRDDINGWAVIDCKKGKNEHLLQVYMEGYRDCFIGSPKHKNLHVKAAHLNALRKLNVRILIT